jgi:hypothetical protein
MMYVTFALFSMWKFMFTPMAGPAAGLNYFETLVSILIGGYISASIFFFGSSYFMQRHQKRRAKRIQKWTNKGRVDKIKPTFNQANKRIIRMKGSLNKWYVCWLVPLFFSIPLGTIITAKFFRHQKNTFNYILIGITINGTLITSGTYLIHAWI